MGPGVKLKDLFLLVSEYYYLPTLLSFLGPLIYWFLLISVLLSLTTQYFIEERRRNLEKSRFSCMTVTGDRKFCKTLYWNCYCICGVNLDRLELWKHFSTHMFVYIFTWPTLFISKWMERYVILSLKSIFLMWIKCSSIILINICVLIISVPIDQNVRK